MSFRHSAGALALVLVSVACGRTAPATPPPGTTASGFPRSVPVPGGRLELARAPERIVPANAGAVDLVTALVGPERIAGLPSQALRYSRLAEDAGAFGALPRFAEYRAEPVLALAPDLVVCDPWGSAETTARLRESGVPVLELEDATSMAAVQGAIALLASALGAEQRAAELLADLARRQAELAARGTRRPRLRTLVYSNYGTQGSTAGAGTTLDEVLRLASLRNVAAESGRSGHVALTFEELLGLDPDVIVVGERGQGEGAGGAETYLRAEPALAGLRAVREDRIVPLPIRLFSTTSHEILAGAELLAARIDALPPLSAEGER